MTARSMEVTRDELEAFAASTGAQIILPAGRAGWARARWRGRRLHAWVDAPGVTS